MSKVASGSPGCDPGNHYFIPLSQNVTQMSDRITWWEDDIFHGWKTKVMVAVTLGHAPTLLRNVTREQKEKHWPTLTSSSEVPALPTRLGLKLSAVLASRRFFFPGQIFVKHLDWHFHRRGSSWAPRNSQVARLVSSDDTMAPSCGSDLSKRLLFRRAVQCKTLKPLCFYLRLC